MAQSGLHVSMGSGSVFCMHNNIYCDIGDGQSITKNLSAFSAHITNIIFILKNSINESFILLDELGLGTDPAEGMGIAVAILEELRQKGCLFVTTTHYPEIKEFVSNMDRLVNAKMEFDRESLKPLYKLSIGMLGENCVLYIARKLGLPEHMLKHAYEEEYDKRGNSAIDVPIMEFPKEKVIEKNVKASQIKKVFKKENSKEAFNKNHLFDIGDSVMVYPRKEVGIVFKKENEKGEMIVQIMEKNRKLIINV